MAGEKRNWLDEPASVAFIAIAGVLAFLIPVAIVFAQALVPPQ